jgi:hypothetical protein
MKTTVDLPAKLLRQIKLRAVRKGQKLKDVFVELLQKGLSSPAAEPREISAPNSIIKTDPKTGFPYIEGSPDAPAQHITAAELIEFEKEILERLGLPR